MDDRFSEDRLFAYDGGFFFFNQTLWFEKHMVGCTVCQNKKK